MSFSVINQKLITDIPHTRFQWVGKNSGPWDQGTGTRHF